jgi:hypothetical protein
MPPAVDGQTEDSMGLQGENLNLTAEKKVKEKTEYYMAKSNRTNK